MLRGMYAWICTGDSDCTDLALFLLALGALLAAGWLSLFAVPAMRAAPALSPGAAHPRRRWFALSIPVAVAAGFAAAERTELVWVWPVLWWMVLAVRWWTVRSRDAASTGSR